MRFGMTAPGEEAYRDSFSCLSNAKLRTVIRLVEKGKLDSTQVAVLSERLSIKEGELIVADIQADGWRRMAESFQLENTRLDLHLVHQERSLVASEQRLQVTEKRLRQQVRRTGWVGVLGAVIAGSILYLK